MSKFNSNIQKIKLFYFNLTGKINKNNFRLNTNIKEQTIKKVLIVFPVQEEEFNVAKYCFRSILSNNDTEYIYLINNIFYSTSHFMGTTYGFNYLRKKNKIIFNDNFLDYNIVNTNFDVIINLECKFHLDIAMMINKIIAKYKIGFKNEYSDLFYNVQFEYTTLENGYNKINSMLQ